MAAFQANPIETTFDHKFARDLVRFVLHEHMKGLHWIPTGIFIKTDLDSPFTPQLKAAVRDQLDCEGHNMHKMFDKYYPDKSHVDDSFLKDSQKSKDSFLTGEFNFELFLSFTVLLAYFGGLSYLYGSIKAPFVCYSLIVKALRELKSMGKVHDDFWIQMQTWLENRKTPVRYSVGEFYQMNTKM